MRKVLLSMALLCATGAFAANPILGEIELDAASKLDKNAGVWLDGQYVGYVKDISGKGRLVVVPGTHELLIKLVGYEDVARSVVVDPGERKQYRVSMQAVADLSYPSKDETARLKISVEPEDAAVFVNGRFVGHVDRFDGRAGMRLAAGTYAITIALPGYQAFETELTVRAGQDYELKTTLAAGGIADQASELTAHASTD